MMTDSIVRLSLVDLRYVAICISEKSRIFPLRLWKCSRFSATAPLAHLQHHLHLHGRR